ncbi:MAG: Eco57I restriction-modification methylase domain-containing protein, partial [Christensenellaceae bacterium]|nr:Eco57I restriction-modification methylase domain-containing protein [Christensenellaceae bacterium]
FVEDNHELLKSAAHVRIKQQTQTAGIPYTLLHTAIAISRKIEFIDENNNRILKDGQKCFSDRDVHDVLKRSGISNYYFDNEKKRNEWFKVDLETAKMAIEAVRDCKASLTPGQITSNLTPIIFRPEQIEAIDETRKTFKKGYQKLWNAKMRFGKTLTALEVVKQGNYKRSLIVSHRPAAFNGWYDDFKKIFYLDSLNFKYGSLTQGYRISDLNRFVNDENGHFVFLVSIQYLRNTATHDEKEEIFNTTWDFLVVDEAHEGTQTEICNDIFDKIIREKHTKVLELSGTPFNLLLSKKYDIDSEIFTWDYIMEQKAKKEWYLYHFGDSNPYENLPKMNIFTYNLSQDIDSEDYIDIADKAFKFSEFFKVYTGNSEYDGVELLDLTQIGKFKHENDVKRLLSLLTTENGSGYPFSTKEYQDYFKHSLWIIPGVKEAKALKELLKNDPVFGNFEIVNVAGAGDSSDSNQALSSNALNLVLNSIAKYDRTITLSCGRLTLGVTVPEWTAVLMLAGSYATSAASYLQTIFRVQSPGSLDGKEKTNCYVFDFAPDRTLKMMAEASTLGLKSDKKHIDRMTELINFCPIISVNRISGMKSFSAEELLEDLKKAVINRVANSGFDDINLYNKEQLSKLNINNIGDFEQLKLILKKITAVRKTNDFEINNQGLTNTSWDIDDAGNIMISEKKLTQEEKDKLKMRRTAISILRTISTRIPLLIYGADVEIEDKITVENFTTIIDDNSWDEFMPRGVTKELFNKFTKYYDATVFVAAGTRLRLEMKAADELPLIERIIAIANIISKFRNPDRETVLTPWRVVNMHMGDAIGGHSFFDEQYVPLSREIDDNINLRYINYPNITDRALNKDTMILDINSKTGLYPLYLAFSLYETLKTKNTNSERLWQKIIKDNIYVVCKTKMAKIITKRTLCGFKDYKANIMTYENIIEELKCDAEHWKKKKEGIKCTSRICNPKKWKIEDKGDKMNFNIVVGNPPYQVIDGGAGASATPIYNLFIELSQKVSTGLVSIISPARWMIGGKGLDDFRMKMLNDKHFMRLINFT